MRTSGPGVVLLLAMVPALAGCGGDVPPDGPGSAVRETLPNGVTVLRYASLPDPRADPVLPDLTLGTGTDDPLYLFGDVRGIEADSEGTIYVLDYQVSEVRAFDREGRFLRTVAAKGEGPGELTETNGMILLGDSILWIQDHGKWMMIGVSPDGAELARVPMHVRSYGYIWTGTVDNMGRFWKPQSQSDTERTFPPRTGLQESSFRRYLNWHDPVSGVTDSVYLGEVRSRTFVSQIGNGYSYSGIPSDPNTLTVVDPDGGFWQVYTAEYRVARLDPAGDTTLVVEVDVEPRPVTPADRDAYVDEVLRFRPDGRRAAEEVASFMPRTKPVVGGLVMDDVGRLWVSQVQDVGEPSRYDIFDRGGKYVGSVLLGFEPSEYLPLRIRHGRIYALTLDELDVPMVVRAPAPTI